MVQWINDISFTVMEETRLKKTFSLEKKVLAWVFALSDAYRYFIILFVIYSYFDLKKVHSMLWYFDINITVFSVVLNLYVPLKIRGLKNEQD